MDELVGAFTKVSIAIHDQFTPAMEGIMSAMYDFAAMIDSDARLPWTSYRYWKAMHSMPIWHEDA
jgi:hypothetical protein